MMQEIQLAPPIKVSNTSSLAEGYTLRPPCPADLEAVVASLNASFQDILGVNHFSVAGIKADWDIPGFDLERDARVVISPQGEIAGYLDVFDLYEPHVRLFCYGNEHPCHSSKGIAASLVAWAGKRARKSIPAAPPEARVVLVASALTLDYKMNTLYRQSGFGLLRHYLRMAIDLNQNLPAPVWPENIRWRAFDLGHDDVALVQAIRNAFSDHFGFVERPFEDELAVNRHFWEHDPDFDPNLCFLALDGDQIAGFSLCHPKVDEDPEMGWVASLGVCRPWRRQGLGLALLLHSFQEFMQRGKTRVGLGVDAESLTGATRLYEKAGMHRCPEWEWSSYELELRPGRDLSKQSLE